jgi:hypothetical protein
MLDQNCLREKSNSDNYRSVVRTKEIKINNCDFNQTENKMFLKSSKSAWPRGTHDLFSKEDVLFSTFITDFLKIK